MMYTRRELGKLALATLPAARLATGPLAVLDAAAAKPDSKVKGVQIGLNVPYDFGNNLMSGDEVLDNCLKLDVSAVELRSQPIEQFMGVPPALLAGPGRGQQTPEQIEARKTAAADLSKWRTSAPLAKAREFRKKYEDAGVLIQILKFDNILAFPDDVLDYGFELAKAVGAGAISCELPVDQVAAAKRLGQFADKHKIMIGFHGHATMTPAIWEQAFTYAKYNGANLDIGHFIGGNKTSPVPFLKQHHDRDHPRPRQGQDLRRRERAVRQRGHADRRGAAGDPRQQVADPGDDRVRVSDPGGIGPHDRNRQECRLLPEGAARLTNR